MKFIGSWLWGQAASWSFLIRYCSQSKCWFERPQNLRTKKYSVGRTMSIRRGERCDYWTKKYEGLRIRWEGIESLHPAKNRKRCETLWQTWRSCGNAQDDAQPLPSEETSRLQRIRRNEVMVQSNQQVKGNHAKKNQNRHRLGNQQMPRIIRQPIARRKKRHTT